MKKLLIMAFLCLAVVISGKDKTEKVELANIKFTKTTTKHFIIFTSKGCSAKYCASNAEEVWERMTKMFPIMSKLITPDDTYGKKPVLVYVSTKDEYNTFGYFLKKHLKAAGLAQQLEYVNKMYERTAAWRLYYFDGTEKPNKEWPFMGQVVLDTGGRKKIAPGRTHFLTTLMAANYMKNTRLPFGLSAGLGYEYEITMSKESVTRYMDYKKYDKYGTDGGNGKISTSKIFDKGGKKWASLIKKEMKKRKGGEKGYLSTSLTISPENLTPVQAGYLYALSKFLTKDEDYCKKYEKFITAIKAGGEVHKSLYEAYGFADQDAMEKAWHAYMKSTKFK